MIHAANTDIFEMVTAEKISFSGTSTSSYSDYLDIDSDKKNPQLCSLYASEIYNNLRVAEVCAMEVICIFVSLSCSHIHCHS